jgi:hypothetical protein
MKQCKTVKLHYGKYLYKLVLANRLNHIFRSELQKTGKLAFAKQELDKLTELHLSGKSIYQQRFRTTVAIGEEHYFDAKVIYESLIDMDEYKIRVDPYQSLAIYSNEKEPLVELSKKLTISAREFWEPDLETIKLLSGDPNIIISEQPVTLHYKVTLGRSRNNKTSELAGWLKNNKDKSKIGSLALSELEKDGWVDGFYFFVRDEKVLMLVQMMVGATIRRVDKIVYKGDIDKY